MVEDVLVRFDQLAKKHKLPYRGITPEEQEECNRRMREILGLCPHSYPVRAIVIPPKAWKKKAHRLLVLQHRVSRLMREAIMGDPFIQFAVRPDPEPIFIIPNSLHKRKRRALAFRDSREKLNLRIFVWRMPPSRFSGL